MLLCIFTTRVSVALRHYSQIGLKRRIIPILKPIWYHVWPLHLAAVSISNGVITCILTTGFYFFPTAAAGYFTCCKVSSLLLQPYGRGGWVHSEGGCATWSEFQIIARNQVTCVARLHRQQGRRHEVRPSLWVASEQPVTWILKYPSTFPLPPPHPIKCSLLL